MLHLQELSDLPPGKRLFVLSRASALLAEDYLAEFASTRVVLHLCCHGIEPFLKSAIHCASGKTPRRTHELHKLTEEYARLFPGPSFQFAITRKREAQGMYEMFSRHQSPR